MIWVIEVRMIFNLIFFLVFLIILIKSSGFSTKYSIRIAKIIHFSEFALSFFFVAFISVLPEAIISIISAVNREPSLAFGTLLGSNIADLTLILGIVILFSSKDIKVKGKILKDSFFYLILFLLPMILGFDGRFSRLDGGILIFTGLIFFVKVYNESKKIRGEKNKEKEFFWKNFLFLVLSLIVLLISAFYTVNFAVNFANDIKIPAILIGLTILALGTCLPELIFSIRAVRKNHNELALGDVLGTVITDTTIVLGIVALICPFSYNLFNIYTIGFAMFLSGFLVIVFMKSDSTLSKTEGLLLILFYVFFIFVEFFLNLIFK
jgi:cation:H+ antiporter